MNSLIKKNRIYLIFFCSFFLGIITTFSFAPFNITFVNFFSFSLLLYLMFISKRENFNNLFFFLLGWVFGFGFFISSIYWITISLTHEEQFKHLIPFALFLIPAFLSIFFGFTTLLSKIFIKQNLSFIILFSIIFSSIEFLRSSIFTGFPWNLIAYTWSWSSESTQILSLIGTHGLGLISITLFCIPYLFLQKKILIKNIFFAFFFLTIFVFNYLFGSSKINKSNYYFDEDIKIKIISPSTTLKDYNSKSETAQLENLIKISNPNKDQKTLFIWPEGIFYQSYLHEINRHRDLFFNNFSEKHLIILGINNFVDNDGKLEPKKYFNSLVVLNNKLDILSIYNKIRLVPFGEFLPFEKILSKLGLKKITAGYNSFSSGDERPMIKLGKEFNKKIILPLVCYEIIYSGKIKKTNQFPDLVINISEDAWFGNSIGPHQHFSKAIYRAVEEGVFIARSANKGISALINPHGKVIKSLNITETGSLEYDFPSYKQSTLFSKFGNKIFFLIIFLYIFLTLIFKKFKI